MPPPHSRTTASRGHDIPGAFAASVRAAGDAEGIGAPAEAHRHYDLALELWVRVEAAERIAGMTRGKLGLKSALAAAASGDVPGAVHLLRRIRGWVTGDRPAESPSGEYRTALPSGSGAPVPPAAEREHQWYAEALGVAAATVRETLDEPPTWYRARAMATYAIALTAANRYDDARDWAGRARRRPAPPGRPPWRRTRSSRPGSCALRAGNSGEAIGMLTGAIERAGAAGAVGVRLRAVSELARNGWREVNWPGQQRRPPWGGMGRRGGTPPGPVGLDLQHLRLPGTLRQGQWDAAQELADVFPVRVTRQAEAVLSAMALFIEVARGNPVVGERRTWLEPLLGPRLRRVHRTRDPRRARPVARGR